MPADRPFPVHVVITTIQAPTPAVRELWERLRPMGASLTVIGDRKGPRAYDLPGVDFYPLGRQRAMPLRLAGLLPEGNYARKNLGYLLAIRGRAPCLYETDDDNQPLESWAPRAEEVSAASPVAHRWCNSYRIRTDRTVWPRGFPLRMARDADLGRLDVAAGLHRVRAPIQQGLANGDPDVDAVWRLSHGEPVTFAPGPGVALPPDTWHPLNSQSTWWWPSAYPLLYLPSTCSMRMTDIWRGYVAQRCLWEMGGVVVVHGPEVFQARNEHDLLRDFQEEWDGYLRVEEAVERLRGLALDRGPGATAGNLRACYRELVHLGVVKVQELPLLEAWLADLSGPPVHAAGGAAPA